MAAELASGEAIRGRVVDAATGAALARVSVRVCVSAAIVTDVEGRFGFEAPAGRARYACTSGDRAGARPSDACEGGGLSAAGSRSVVPALLRSADCGRPRLHAAGLSRVDQLPARLGARVPSLHPARAANNLTGWAAYAYGRSRS